MYANAAARRDVGHIRSHSFDLARDLVTWRHWQIVDLGNPGAIMFVGMTDARRGNANQNVRRSDFRTWNFRILQRLCDLRKPHRLHSLNGHFFSVVPVAGEVGAPGWAKSELNMSVVTFHLPSACFFHTSQYLPLSLVPSFIVIWYVPTVNAMSPDFDASTRVVFQLMSAKLSRNPFHKSRMPVFAVTIGPFGGRTIASSA